ncbi:MAG: hypothetical protein R6U44_00545 [Archaeoglobaceae archaeon]
MSMKKNNLKKLIPTLTLFLIAVLTAGCAEEGMSGEDPLGEQMPGEEEQMPGEEEQMPGEEKTNGNGEASEDEISQKVQTMVDQQMQQQEQQLALMAQQNDNISEEDVSIDASVEDVSSSQFDSLYEVSVAVTGNAPSQTGELEPINQEQEMYVTEDGRYVFQQPTDLEQSTEEGTSGDGETASEEEISQKVQTMVDQQMQQQEQELALLAQQNEDISEDDISIDASVQDVSSSQFDSLYEVSVAVTGNAPSQTGELEPINQEQEMYVTEDGRYVFQQPTDLEQPQQQPTDME